MRNKNFHARIWGARGSLASTCGSMSKYGGNTVCVEVLCGEDRLIFDAGTGLRCLGDKLFTEAIKSDARGEKRKTVNVFFSHCHYDHIEGVPFFAPLFDKKSKVSFWSGHLAGPDKTLRMIKNFLRSPFFPVGPEVFSAKIKYKDFEPLDVLRPVKGVTVRTIPLNHHDNCVGYRINFDGRSICYITDTTHIANKLDEEIIEFVRDSDLMIYDATYTDAEFPQFWNYGHSTWQEGVRISQAANVKRYCIFHHRPSRDDAALDVIAAHCKKQFFRSWVAREGLIIKV